MSVSFDQVQQQAADVDTVMATTNASVQNATGLSSDDVAQWSNAFSAYQTWGSALNAALADPTAPSDGMYDDSSGWQQASTQLDTYNQTATAMQATVASVGQTAPPATSGGSGGGSGGSGGQGVTPPPATTSGGSSSGGGLKGLSLGGILGALAGGAVGFVVAGPVGARVGAMVAGVIGAAIGFKEA